MCISSSYGQYHIIQLKLEVYTMVNFPTSSTSYFVNSHFVNIDQMGIDEVGIDKVGIDDVGRYQNTQRRYLPRRILDGNEEVSGIKVS